MSFTYGSQFPRDGAVVYYDMNNRVRSYPGEPTTNTILYSNDFTQWTKSGAIDAIPTSWEKGPYGQMDAKKITLNGSGGGYINRSGDTIISAGQTWTKSIYAKAGSLQKVVNEFSDDGSFHVTIFDVGRGTVSGAGVGTTQKMTYIGNGWYRCSCTRTFITASGGGVWYLGEYGNSAAGHLFVHGGQVENKSEPTPLMTTSGSIGVRNSTIKNIIDKQELPITNAVYQSNEFSFNGSTSITVPIDQNFFNSSQWTICTWLKFDQVNRGVDNRIIFSSETGAINKQLHLVERGGRLYYGFYSNDMNGIRTLVANQWYFVTFNYDPSTRIRQIYINGALDVSGTAGSAYTGVVPNFLVGSQCVGKLPMLSVHNRILTTQELNRIFEATKSRYGIT